MNYKEMKEFNEETCKAILGCTEDVGAWLTDLAQEEHRGDKGLLEALFLSGFSSGLGKKEHLIHIWATGEAQSGKSHSQNTVKQFFPVHDTLQDISSRVPVHRKYLDKSILHIDDDHIKYEALQLLKMFTSPDDTNPVSEIVIDMKIVRREFPQVIAVWKNSVTTPNDEQLMSRFLLFRTNNTPINIVEFMSAQPKISKETLTRAQAIIAFLLSQEVKVEIKYMPRVNGNCTPRQYKFIQNLLRAITYANRYTNPSFDEKSNVVYPCWRDYGVLERVIHNSNLFENNILDGLDKQIYVWVRDNASFERAKELKDIARAVGQTEDIVRRRLQKLNPWISSTTGLNGRYLYYLAVPVSQNCSLEIPREVREEESKLKNGERKEVTV